jgi:hypothetical protein
MKVRCIKTGIHEFIRIGQEYEVIEEQVKGCYQIMNNNNQYFSYEKELFELVEDENVEVIKIKEWSELDGVKNDKFVIICKGRSNVISMFTKGEEFYVGDLCTDYIDEKTIIGILKLVGFDVEFIKSPLEQVKDIIKNRISVVNNWTCYNEELENDKLVIKGEMQSLLKEIERIEKNEP